MESHRVVLVPRAITTLFLRLLSLLEDFELYLRYYNIMPVENDYFVSTQKFDFTVDEGKGRLNPSVSQ